jgi:serine phosphatase RsbU (regulator of sigma subunit)/pSer/pThr/pTyr-binding forkhead associated (FHA) protein
MDAIVLDAESEHVLGRGLDCSVKLPEEATTVSRRHCRFNVVAGNWFITDLGSRHGTYLNADRLSKDEPARISRGDRIRLGPWTLRVARPGEPSFNTVSTQEVPAGQEQLVTVAAVGRENIHRRRLELLLDCAKRVAESTDELGLSRGVLDVLIDGTGYSLVAVIRPGSDAHHIEVLGWRSKGRTELPTFSRSLINAAFGGQVVRMRRESMASQMQTVVSSSIQTALCVPVLQGSTTRTTALCLYLDSREGDAPVHDDAAAFCQAVADMCALCLANIRRGRLEIEAAALDVQINAAKQIQRQILPAAQGAFGPLRFAHRVVPGQSVAGDLFDIVQLDERHVAFFVGDVAGKGLPASLLMAMVQSGLSVALCQTRDPQDAVRRVNTQLFRTAPDDKFVSLWLGIIDLLSGDLRFIDAGHGYAMLRRPNALPEVIASRGGVPLRVIADEPYAAETLQLLPGSRLILYSDGLVEQRSPAGEEFGVARVLSTLRPPMAQHEELDALMTALRQHAGPAAAGALADDVTIVSIAYDPD